MDVFGMAGPTCGMTQVSALEQQPHQAGILAVDGQKGRPR